MVTMQHTVILVHESYVSMSTAIMIKKLVETSVFCVYGGRIVAYSSTIDTVVAIGRRASDARSRAVYDVLYHCAPST
jgi:hypothetical protein